MTSQKRVDIQQCNGHHLLFFCFWCQTLLLRPEARLDGLTAVREEKGEREDFTISEDYHSFIHPAFQQRGVLITSDEYKTLRALYPHSCSLNLLLNSCPTVRIFLPLKDQVCQLPSIPQQLPPSQPLSASPSPRCRPHSDWIDFLLLRQKSGN